MPPFFFSLSFWQALSYVVAALVAYFTPYKLEAGVLLVLILAILKMFNIVPEFRNTYGSMSNVPPFVYILAFWQSLAYIVAAFVAYFTPYKLEAGILLAVFLALLKMVNIVPELRARGFIH